MIQGVDPRPIGWGGRKEAASHKCDWPGCKELSREGMSSCGGMEKYASRGWAPVRRKAAEGLTHASTRTLRHESLETRDCWIHFLRRLLSWGLYQARTVQLQRPSSPLRIPVLLAPTQQLSRYLPLCTPGQGGPGRGGSPTGECKAETEILRERVRRGGHLAPGRGPDSGHTPYSQRQRTMEVASEAFHVDQGQMECDSLKLVQCGEPLLRDKLSQLQLGQPDFTGMGGVSLLSPGPISPDPQNMRPMHRYICCW